MTGTPTSTFVDIGSYGLWGEGHTMMSSRVAKDRAREIIEQHLTFTSSTSSIRCWPSTTTWRAPSSRALTCRKPIWPSPGALPCATTASWSSGPPHSWHHAELAQAFWPRRPVILEHEHYGASKNRGAWGDGSLLLKAVEEYHASYLSIHWWPHEFLEENKAVIDRINRRLGYRIQLRELTWPREVTIGQPFTVRKPLGERGRGPCYPGGFPALDPQGFQGGHRRRAR